MIQQTSLPFGILIGVTRLEITWPVAPIMACQKTVVPVPQVDPVPYLSVGKVSAEKVAAAADDPNSISVIYIARLPAIAEQAAVRPVAVDTATTQLKPSFVALHCGLAE
jgi:hypothetical protein